MDFEPFAHRQRFLIVHVLHQRRNVGRRRRRCYAKQHFHDVFAALTGDVLLASDVNVRKLAWPSNPKRFGSVTGTRLNVGPDTLGIP